MWIPKEIGRAAKRLKEGHRLNRISVRDLLRIFKAERRGLNKIHDIRVALDNLGLVTDPDFESAWIDALIRIRLKNVDGVQPADAPNDTPGTSDVKDEDESGESLISTNEEDGADSQELSTGTEAQIQIVVASEGVVETVSSGSAADPTFRIGSLPAANKPLITVAQDDSVKKAVTRMLQLDYSQLPIMRGEREVKGMISWKSVSSRYAIGGDCCQVENCREDAHVIDANRTLFEAIPTIVGNGYVLVRDPQNRRITGIVTASDLSLQFQQLAQPFLLLREIELHIRHLLQDKVLPEDFDWLASADPTGPRSMSITDLSFGGYIRLIQRPQVWAKLALNIDQASLTAQMEDVRQIRNEVMHFDPDPMTAKQLDVLKQAANFMQQLYALLP